MPFPALGVKYRTTEHFSLLLLLSQSVFLSPLPLPLEVQNRKGDGGPWITLEVETTIRHQKFAHINMSVVF